MHLSTDVSAARDAKRGGQEDRSLRSKSREAWVSYRTMQERAKMKDTAALVPLRAPSRDGATVIAKHGDRARLGPRSDRD